MILEKDSSVLGYPGETSKALDADHHNVCKYDSPKDPNYIIVRNVLASLIGKINLTSSSTNPPAPDRKESHDLKSLLAITELPDVDYIYFRDQWAPGTNEWLIEETEYLDWLHARGSVSSILWLYGGAATGKSVLASFIINNLVEQGLSCQYFFIRFGDHQKRRMNMLLRSIAYQIARCVPDFLQKMLRLVDEAIDFETADSRTIWERIFKAILFNMQGAQPLYWIIDGLDEADDPRATVRLFSDVGMSSVPIRILLISRKTSEIATIFHKVSKSLNVRTICAEGHQEDLRYYIGQELSMSGTPSFVESVVERVIELAQNNFLVSAIMVYP